MSANPSIYSKVFINEENVLSYVCEFPGETVWMMNADFGHRGPFLLIPHLEWLQKDGKVYTRVERGAVRFYPTETYLAKCES